MATSDKSIEQDLFKKNERIFTSKTFKYLARIVILYLFSIIFKSFDLTFIEDVHNTFFRSLLFSVLYVTLGLICWEGAIWLSRYVERGVLKGYISNRLLVLCTAMLLYGLIPAFLFGFLYALMDIIVFNRYEAWESFKAVSYNMNFGLYIFYVLILTFNGIIYYYKGLKEYQVQTERLKRENIQAQYDALRNQIDPHFFFNSLSVLTNLVYKSADLSADYITQLAKIYRYILDKKFENLVSIQTELDFLDSYLFLISIRHQNSIRFTAEIDEQIKAQGTIPPATLQMLIENAIKHNRFSANDPLLIHVKSEGGYLLVSNQVRKKNVPAISSGIGLENIRKRYELASGRVIEIHRSDEVFIVKIPVITP